MWEIYEHSKVIKQIQKIPSEILRRYEKWKDIVRISGPQGLGLIRDFNDESLSGNWEGHRSSRLNLQYRVIYKIDQEQIFVKVMKVTPHDYRSN
ncbi:MAG: type II toxin-antitoxin system mRNA interferase toxin, RelE/StbE family [Gammaproteobacteria bacterium]|nr:MAG: type II toxin-antitoxin system mRNA interferase toxin, RelE/StbE family [Gammaproteobacteria bacterium]